MMYEPLYVEHGIPHYDLSDVLRHGDPTFFGVSEYSVVDNPTYSCPLMLEWKDEVALMEDGVYKHRYDRLERFRGTLFQLIGGSRVTIPWYVYHTIRSEMYNPHPDKVWDSVRDILKNYGYTKFYNRIPCILRYFNYPHKIIMKKNTLCNIINDFFKVNKWFEDVGKAEFGMNYFPNIRYMALKLMERNGVEFQYKVPFIRVKKVEERYDEIWNMIDIFVF